MVSEKEKDEPEIKAGYLVLRMRIGQGVVLHELIEIRIASIKTNGEVNVAIRAPKDIPIRRLK